MAEVKRYVNPASTGGDGTTNGLTGATAAYASLSAWDAAEQTDLVTATDTHVVECAGTADTTVCDINGWTVNATYFITVTVASASRHDGTPQSGYHLTGASSNNLGMLSISENYTVVNWLDAENTTATGATTCGIDVRASNVELRQTIAGPAHDMAVRANTGFVSSAYAGFVQLINCLLHSSEFGIYSFDAARERYRAYNCVAANNSNRGFSEAGTNVPEVINCVSYGNTTIDYEAGTYTAASDDNASSDTSADTEFTTGINSITSSFFTDAANEDFHLTSSATTLHNAGQDISAYTTIDIDNLSRDATPSIGYHEYVAVGGANPKGPLGMPLKGPFGGPI